MPKYKLTYFNIRWLGEGARLLFHYSGTPFEDVRIPREQWPELKPTMPFGQLPILEVDGQVIPQSAAIYRYLGRKFNLVPQSAIEEAQVDSIYDAHKDFMSELRDFVLVAVGFRQGDKDKVMKEIALPARDKYFAQVENILKKSGGKYLVGNSVSWADIVISDNLYVINGLVPTLFNGHNAVKKFADHIHTLPRLQKYLAERPHSDI